MKDQAPKAQKQDKQPGDQFKMSPKPESKADNAQKRKLEGKVAIISGGDSGIGRAVALAFVKEGAKVCITYLNEKRDAEDTEKLIKEAGGNCLLIAGDIDRKSTRLNSSH